MKVNVLGTDYEIVVKTGAEDELLRHGHCGYCDSSVKRIVIAPHEPDPADIYQVEDREQERRATLRHEILHAFLAESGLTNGNSWSQNENCVEWIAQMFPKLIHAFIDAGALNEVERGLCEVIAGNMLSAD